MQLEFYGKSAQTRPPVSRQTPSRHQQQSRAFSVFLGLGLIPLMTKIRRRSLRWTRLFIYLRQFRTVVSRVLNGEAVICTDLRAHRELPFTLMTFLLTNHRNNNEETELPLHIFGFIAQSTAGILVQRSRKF